MESRDIHVLGRQAVALHQQGRPLEAEKLYREILAINPRVFPALYLLGVLRLHQGDSAEAVSLIEQALADYQAVLAGDPGNADAWGCAANQRMNWST